jgi:glutaredoxin 3
MADVTMYTAQNCGFCLRAAQLLQRKGVTALVKIDIDSQPGARESMITRTGRRSVPQIFIGETHVGGYDDLLALDRDGRLDVLLTQ